MKSTLSMNQMYPNVQESLLTKSKDLSCQTHNSLSFKTKQNGTISDHLGREVKVDESSPVFMSSAVNNEKSMRQSDLSSMKRASREAVVPIKKRKMSREGLKRSEDVDSRSNSPKKMEKVQSKSYTAKAENNDTNDHGQLVMTAASALTTLTSSSTSEENEEPDLSATSTEEDDCSSPNGRNQDKRTLRFPVKLMSILSCGKYDDIIAWTPDGLSFVVHKPKDLVEIVFPLYFKKEAVQYSSFTRKLHRWGFIKIMRGKNLSAFCHRNFKRGNFDRCEAMRCSKPHAQSEFYPASMPRPEDFLRENQNMRLQDQLPYLKALESQHALGSINKLPFSHLLTLNDLDMSQTKNHFQHPHTRLDRYDDIMHHIVNPPTQSSLPNRISFLQMANLTQPNPISMPLVNSTRNLNDLQALADSGNTLNMGLDNLPVSLPLSALQGMDTRLHQRQQNDLNLLNLLNENRVRNTASVPSIFNNFGL